MLQQALPKRYRVAIRGSACRLDILGGERAGTLLLSYSPAVVGYYIPYKSKSIYATQVLLTPDSNNPLVPTGATARLRGHSCTVVQGVHSGPQDVPRIITLWLAKDMPLNLPNWRCWVCTADTAYFDARFYQDNPLAWGWPAGLLPLKFCVEDPGGIQVCYTLSRLQPGLQSLRRVAPAKYLRRYRRMPACK